MQEFVATENGSITPIDITCIAEQCGPEPRFIWKIGKRVTHKTYTVTLRTPLQMTLFCMTITPREALYQGLVRETLVFIMTSLRGSPSSPRPQWTARGSLATSSTRATTLLPERMSSQPGSRSE